jgi:protein-disulfide isomerase
MKRLTLFALLPLILAPLACAQSTADNTDRSQRILDNLQFEFPQLRETTLEMTEFGPSGIDGLDRGTFVINGQQEQEFLVSSDDTQFYLVITGPIDVSRDAEALAAANRERDQEALVEAGNRAEELNQTFANLPVRGNPNAPVTIIEFSDFQCPYCARAYNTIEQVLENNPNDARLIYVQYPLPNHQWARPASMATLCAAQQEDEAFWVLHDQYFENQRSMTAANVLDRSREWLAGTGVDLDEWSTCVQDAGSTSHQEARAELDKGMQVASDLGVTGTPAFFINGRFLNGAQPAEVFQAFIDDASGN